MLEYFPGAIAVYQFGSRCYGFIEHPDDYDYIAVYETPDDIRKHNDDLQKLWETNTKEKEDEQAKQKFHFFCLALSDVTSGRYLWLHDHPEEYEDCYFAGAFYKTPLGVLNTVLIHWLILVDGVDTKIQSYIKFTPDYLKLIRSGLECFRFQLIYACKPDQSKAAIKKWYYLFMIYFVATKKNFDLTAREIQFLNDLHDRKVSLEECELQSQLLEHY